MAGDLLEPPQRLSDGCCSACSDWVAPGAWYHHQQYHVTCRLLNKPFDHLKTYFTQEQLELAAAREKELRQQYRERRQAARRVIASGTSGAGAGLGGATSSGWAPGSPAAAGAGAAGRDCSQHKPSWFLVPCSSHNGESEDEQMSEEDEPELESDEEEESDSENRPSNEQKRGSGKRQTANQARGRGGGAKRAKTGGRYQRITPGAAHEQAAHYSEQDKAAHIHMLQTEPRRVAAAARERGGHPLEEALPCLESLTRAALGLEPDAEDVWFTPARIADFTEAVKQAVAEGQALIIQTGSYESLEANPWSLHVLQFTEGLTFAPGTRTVLYDLVQTRVEQGPGGNDHKGRGRTHIDLSSSRWVRSLRLTMQLVMAHCLRELWLPQLHSRLHCSSMQLLNAQLAGLVGALFGCEPNLPAILLIGWSWEVNASFSADGTLCTSAIPLVSTRDRKSMAPGLLAAADYAGRPVICLRGYHPEGVVDSIVGVLEQKDMERTCAAREWGLPGSHDVEDPAARGGLAMRRLDFNNVALLTIADICTGMQPSVRIPLHPSLLTSSGSVQDPAFMESAALMSRFGDYPNYEVWRNKRNGHAGAAAAGASFLEQHPALGAQMVQKAEEQLLQKGCTEDEARQRALESLGGHAINMILGKKKRQELGEEGVAKVAAMLRARKDGTPPSEEDVTAVLQAMASSDHGRAGVVAQGKKPLDGPGKEWTAPQLAALLERSRTLKLEQQAAAAAAERGRKGIVAKVLPRTAVEEPYRFSIPIDFAEAHMLSLVDKPFSLRCGSALYTCTLVQHRRQTGYCEYFLKGPGWKELVEVEKPRQDDTVYLQMSGKTVLNISLSDEQGADAAPAAATAALPPPTLAGGLGLWPSMQPGMLPMLPAIAVAPDPLAWAAATAAAVGAAAPPTLAGGLGLWPGMLPGLWAASAMATNQPAWVASPAAATAAAPPPTLAGGLGLLPASAMAANSPAGMAEVAGAALGMPKQPQPEVALACELDSQLPAAAQCGEFMALMSDALMH